MRFKVGDEVKLLTNGGFPSCTAGEIGAVTGIDNNGVDVQLGEKNRYFYFREVELITDNNMKFKVGDKVRLTPRKTAFVYPDGSLATIINITNNSRYTLRMEDGHSQYTSYDEDLELVTSAGKIVAYELLKDTPEASKGLIVSYKEAINGDQAGYYAKHGNEIFYFKRTVESKPEWFKPIYEEVKPTEVKVTTHAGEVIVTKDTLRINGESPISYQAFVGITDIIKGASTATKGGYPIKIATFMVGCKTFKFTDIAALEAAIKQVM